MNSISEIIAILSKEEKRDFVLHLKKKNRRGDTKNLQLFKAFEADKTENLDDRLYGRSAKNAFHALSKRLHDNLVDFVASKSFALETSEEMEILKLLLAARIFYEHKLNKIALRTLAKSEKKALQLDLYSILNEIYQTKLQYAHLHPNLQLSEIISEANRNIELFQKEIQLTMVYASIKEQRRQKETRPLTEIISETFSNFNIEIDSSLTYKSLYQLLTISSEAAKLQSDYYTFYPFMVNAYNVIQEKKATANKHLYYHLEILNLMAVSNFRNKNFTASLKFTGSMEKEMLQQNRKYHARFVEKLTLLKALNANYTGNPELAVSLLKNDTTDSPDIQLTLIMCHFQQHNFKEAYAIMKDLYHSDVWYEKKAGWIWVLKKSMIEILLLIELDKLDLVLSRLQSFEKKFTPRLKQIGEERVITFMKLVTTYYKAPNLVTTPEFKAKVENSFQWLGVEREDIFVMSFYAWLKGKMERKNTYQVTLELVHP